MAARLLLTSPQMPSTIHQGLVWAFADDPALGFDLLREVFGLELPALESFTDRRAELDRYAPCFGDTHELRPDLALSADVPGTKRGGIALIVEVQRQLESRKRWRLWVYWALLAEQLRRSTAVMLVTIDDAVARWARRLGTKEVPPRECLQVLDRQNMPRVTNLEDARQRPAKALLSALLHAGRDDIEVMSTAFTVALELPDDRRWRYTSCILAAASKHLKAELLGNLTMTERYELTQLERNSIAFDDGRQEGLVEGKREGLVEGLVEGKREGLVEGLVEGKREGLARLVLTILELRSLPVDAGSERRIRACTDLDLLERWATRAKHAASCRQLFD